MADGRMLHKKISLNEAVASLENDMNRLLFTWAISHLDIEGRISGSPKVFRAIVVPLLEHITSEKVSKFFKDAESKGLILRYQIDKVWFIQYPKFKDNQRLRVDREAPSKIPPPPDNCLITPGEVLEDSRSTPALSLSKDKLSKDKLIEDLSVSPTPDLPSNGLKPDSLAKLWNERAPKQLSRVNLPLRRKPKDLEKIRAALRLNPDLIWWQNVFDRIQESAFLCGSNKRGWKASFDFVVDKAELILDGKYSDGSSGSQPGIASWLAREQEKDRLIDS